MPQAFHPRRLLVRPDDFGRYDLDPLWKPFPRFPKNHKQRDKFAQVGVAYVQHRLVAAIREHLDDGYDAYEQAALKKSKTGRLRPGSVGREMREQFASLVGDSEWVVRNVFRGDVPIQFRQIVAWSLLYEFELFPRLEYEEDLVPPPEQTRGGK